ncbi:MAG: CBS domain-containing protein, partial [Phycisphaerales bacterium]|nr:CBS domain-containing protein [Phycisphaerales bacterium]
AMGTQDIRSSLDGEEHRAFMRRVLDDLRALEELLDSDLVEDGITRIGAEQEVVLVDRNWNPAPVAEKVLSLIDDPHVTNELAKFNVEVNLDPLRFEGDCLKVLERELRRLCDVVGEAAARCHADIILTGILPTLQLRDLSRENLTPRERYFALDDTITALRGGHYELQIKGTDELTVRHDSIMLEALNTSFQVHYQVGPSNFAHAYNIAQAVAGPVLASAVNSPILFGKRLWRETRIAIFQQAVDTRGRTPNERDTVARVRFGEGWCDRSIVEIYRNDIARFRLLFGDPREEDPFEAIRAGRAPALRALQTHNSTVYRWNRSCYPLSAYLAHLLIYNRVFPSVPTITDELANAAFWFGLMRGGQEAWPDLTARLDFDDARSNFIAAAREGLGSTFAWLDGTQRPSRDLILEDLLPVAREGLRLASIDRDDADRLLGIIEARVESLQTGAQWMLQTVARMKGKGTRAERLLCLTSATSRRQHTGDPVHTWSVAELGEHGAWQRGYMKVDQYMTTDLFTVREDEPIDLVASIMDWEYIRHIPVEDEDHNLVGMVSYRNLLHYLSRRRAEQLPSVGEIMTRDPLTIPPETSTLHAIELMREHRVSCLPVVDGGRLIGIVTEHDFMKIAGQLLEQGLREDES